MTRIITGSNGDQVVVDGEDADLALLNWYIQQRGYAHRKEAKKTVYLH
jgi:hypothetical protein